jgi:hypothetical protein
MVDVVEPDAAKLSWYIRDRNVGLVPSLRLKIRQEREVLADGLPNCRS